MNARRIAHQVRVALLMCCFFGTPLQALANDVPVRLPDGTVLQVKVGSNGMPDPAKTSLFTVDTVGMLMNSKDKLAMWAIGGDVKTSSPLDITIEPLLMPGTSVKTEGAPGQRFSFHGWDTDGTPAAWKWLDDRGTSYFPVKVSGQDRTTAQTVSVVACGAFNPMMKEVIKRSIEWGGTAYSYTLPDGTFCEIPTRKGRIVHANCTGYKVENLSVRQTLDHAWVWTLKMGISDPQAKKLVLSSPIDPQWKLEEPIAGQSDLSVDFAPLKDGGPMWKWLDTSGDTFIPLQVEVLGSDRPIDRSLEWAVGNINSRAMVRAKH